MKTSEHTNEISAALAKFQATHDEIKKDQKVNIPTKKGYTISYNYAGHASIKKAIKNAMGENGLAIVQEANTEQAGMLITTRLTHASGQWYETEMMVPVNFSDIKLVGSSMTYGRRYAETAILGLVADDDVDDLDKNNSKDSRDHYSQRPENPAPKTAGGLSDKQLKRMFAISKSNGWEKEQVKDIMKSLVGKESSKDLNKDEYDMVCEHMENNSPVSNDSVDSIPDVEF